MNEIWSLTGDDYLKICLDAEANGKKPGDSMEQEIREYMKEKGRKPIGHTELNIDEMIIEGISKGKSILHVDINKKGKTSYKIFKKRGDNDAEKFA